ncbi:MAG: FliA/WhiG family RNA polymerase sigma factor [Candidatus Melainabacteria bacterium]|jgi:RNA polymerase sigma factor for flagellar operon FliA|nr:FliA/WhiG family RNA polymerase sigma factor [Candidatus Melainabacteria bacterium]
MVTSSSQSDSKGSTESKKELLISHPLQLNLKSVERKAENTRLWARYNQVNKKTELREQLIIRYAHLVNWVVGRFPQLETADFDKEDLMGYGTIGLIEAIDRFDNAKDCSFETFATNRIRGAILDFLRSRDFLSRNSRERVKRFNQRLAELESRLGYTPTDEEIKKHLTIENEDLRVLQQESSAVIFSLDAQENGNSSEESSVALVDKMPSKTEATEDYAESNLVRDKLAAAIDSLKERERLIISLYHYEKLTFKEIGTILDISESRASQLHQKSLQKLRTIMKDFVI